MVLPAIAIMGPTATGKSAVAMALAAHIDAEIISVDSAQVYRGMDRGTAKPSEAELAQVPHHLIDIREPEQTYSAGLFRRDALGLIEQIQERGRTPLLVGGTMLYFNALLNGIADLPDASPTLRAEIDAEAVELGWPAMHDRLTRLDPVAAAAIQPQDRQRIQRALEIHGLTGRTKTELHGAVSPCAPPIAAFALTPEDRSELHARIGRRLDAMLADGLVDEVATLRTRPGLSAKTPSMRAVGYRQVWEHLDGRFDLADARDRAAAATRNLAKRQITWLSKFPAAGRVQITERMPAEDVARLMLSLMRA